MYQSTPIQISTLLLIVFFNLQNIQALPYYQPEPIELPEAQRIVPVSNDSELVNAIDNALPGDRIVLADGNYAGINIVELKGTPSAPIVFVAANKRQAIISGSKNGRNIRLSGCEYLHFYSLRLTNADVWGLTMGPAYSTDTNSLGCHSMRVVDCEIDHAGQELLKVNGNSSNIEIIGNKLHHTGMSGGNKPYAEGIYIGDGGTGNDRSHDILIQGNHIHNIGNDNAWGEAIDLKVKIYNITIVDNLIEDVIVHSQGAITVLINNHNYPSGATDPNILIARNVIRKVRHHGSGWNGAGISAGSNGVSIINNIIWDTDESALTVTKNAANTSGGFHVYHNTLWNDVIINQSGLGGANSPVEAILRNNLIKGLGGSSHDFSAVDSDCVGPLEFSAIANTYTGSGFELNSNSMAIGAGSSLDSVNYDLTGKLRPSGTPSMGALEFLGEDVPPSILYVVSFSSSIGGTIEGTLAQEVVAGGSTTSVNALPEAGYTFIGWSGSYTGGENPLRISEVTEDLSITANFAQIEEFETPTSLYAINCGGLAYSGSTGINYLADSYYTGGKIATRANPIAGTVDDFVYQSERYGTFTYSFPLENGSYTVILQFSETYWNAPSARQVSCMVEGSTAIYDMDIYDIVGPNTRYDVYIPANVQDGALDLNFTASIDKAKLSGIVIQTPSINTYTIDTDSDGLPDNYELRYGLQPHIAGDSTIDTDGDGLNNLFEFAYNLDPTDPSDAIGCTSELVLLSNEVSPRFQMSYRRRVGGSGNAIQGYQVDGIHYQILCNQSLDGQWQDSTHFMEELSGTTPHGDGTETVHVRSIVSTEDTPALFLKLALSAP
ncbi:MAG: malectin domain-containing carbohydrate-binding protein [Opitutales bacterium]